MNLDIVCWWLSEYNPGAHAALMENNTGHIPVIFLGFVYVYNTGLKHSETDVVEREVFVDQLGLAAAKI
jgi:hypothetical protein